MQRVSEQEKYLSEERDIRVFTRCAISKTTEYSDCRTDDDYIILKCNNILYVGEERETASDKYI